MTSNTTPYPLPEPKRGKTTVKPGACSPVRSSYVVHVTDPEIRAMALMIGGTPSRAVQDGIEFESRANAQLITIAMQQKAAGEAEACKKAAEARRKGLSDNEFRAALDAAFNEIVRLTARDADMAGV